MNTIQHHFRFRWFFRSYNSLFNFFGLLLPLIIIFTYTFDSVVNGRTITLAGILDRIPYILIIWLFTAPLLILTGNYFTEVISDECGLHVNYIWGKLDVPWANIISIKPMFVIQKKTMVITFRLKSLPFIHRFYSFYSTLRFNPCIIIHKELLMESDELMRRIATAVQRNQEVAACKR
jgi:hypothetical protein